MRLSNFMDLKSRVPIAFVCILLAASLIYFSQLAIVQFILVICLGAIAVTGMWEFSQMLQTKEIQLPWSILSIGACVWLIFLYISLFHEKMYFISGVVLGLLSLAVFVYHFNKIQNSIITISCSFFGFLYIVVPLGLMLKILYPYSHQDGRIWLAYLIAVTKGADVGAYFIGKLFGKRRLAASLSPGKTAAGAIGGFILSLLISFAFYLLSLFLKPGVFRLGFSQMILYGAFIGIIAQVGDLAESLFKRDVNVKDSNALPGVGGVLDLLDSLLFTTPLLYLFMKIL